MWSRRHCAFSPPILLDQSQQMAAPPRPATGFFLLKRGFFLPTVARCLLVGDCLILGDLLYYCSVFTLQQKAPPVNCCCYLVLYGWNKIELHYLWDCCKAKVLLYVAVWRILFFITSSVLYHTDNHSLSHSRLWASQSFQLTDPH